MTPTALRLLALLALFISATSATTSPFKPVSNAFTKLIGTNPKIIQLGNASQPLFHEAAVYHPPTKALWVNTDYIKTADGEITYLQRITGLESAESLEIDRINTDIPHPIGGFRYLPGTSLGDVILFVAQGTKAKMPPGGLYALNPYPPYNSSLLLGSYGDYPFNSLDDVTVTVDGTIYISDPVYGYLAGNRPLPLLPNQVYAFYPDTKEVRVAADGFGRPNGLASSPDGKTIYIGDTGASIGNSSLDTQGPRSIYAYNLSGKFLDNRHVFAMPQALASAADGLKVDTKGNVWGGVTGEGVNVWDANGTLLGKIELDGTVGDIGFGEPGELFVLSGEFLYKILLDGSVEGVGVGA